MEYRKWTEDAREEAVKLIISCMNDGLSFRMISKIHKERVPDRSVWYEWLLADKNLSDQYAQAMTNRTEVLADEVIDIADNVGQDIIYDMDGNEVVNHAVIQRDRLRVDARRWMLGKLKPKKYGDKLELDGEVKLTTTVINLGRGTKPPEKNEQ